VGRCCPDVVVGNRRVAEFRQSYPDYGVEIETETNRLMNERLRENRILNDGEPDLDLYSGMIAFSNKPVVVENFSRRLEHVGDQDVDPMTLEGWMHAQVYGVVLAKHAGLRVSGVEVPYYYCLAQRGNETNPNNVDAFSAKRMKQQEIGEMGVRLLAETLSGRQVHLVEEN